MRKKIKEEDNIHKEWYDQANKQTLETLPEFLRMLSEDFEHDYGTICHAVTAASVAAAYALMSTPQGGITGFQAGAVMWEFIRYWSYKSNKSGLRIIDYDNLLYPQYVENFDKVITKNQWSKLQEQAKLNLEESTMAVDRVRKHWESIAAGNIPFGFKLKED